MSFSPPARLYLIRHGETDWNVEARLQGQHDIPLNEVGRRQAAEAGRRLRDLGVPVERLPWHASPQSRALETALLARAAVGLPREGLILDDRLKELSFGEWEGLVWREVVARDPARASARTADKWGFVPPGGESYAMLADRVRPWLETLRSDAIIVSHGGVARVMLALLAGMDTREAPNADIWQGRVLIFEKGTARWD